MKNAASVFPCEGYLGYVPRSEMSHHMLALWVLEFLLCTVFLFTRRWKEVPPKQLGAENWTESHSKNLSKARLTVF